MNNPQAVFAHLEEVRTQTQQYLDGLTQKQLDWRPLPVDGHQCISGGGK